MARATLLSQMQKLPVDFLKVSSYRIPTQTREADGTFEWDSTTMVVVEVGAQEKTGLGFTYGHQAVQTVIEESFRHLIEGADALDIPCLRLNLIDAVRNTGWRGVAAHAISAVDCAVWDLKAKIFDVPLCRLWGQARDSVPVYGSGGFTSESPDQLANELEEWKALGIDCIKMKVGRHPTDDLKRVGQARAVMGGEAGLFVDANGAFQRKEALCFAQHLKDFNVTWFEEPVSSDDLEGLRLLRDRSPACMDITAGEYGYECFYFRRMLEMSSIDVLQADATRCGGYSGFFQACELARAFHIPLSSHTAPSLHLHACLADGNIRHMEYFYDHVRIEQRYFEGVPEIRLGRLYPRLDRPGHGLDIKRRDLEEFSV